VTGSLSLKELALYCDLGRGLFRVHCEIGVDELVNLIFHHIP